MNNFPSSGFPTGEQLLEQFGGEKSVRDQIIRSFLDSGSKNLAGIEEALKNKDPETLRESTHSYKGSLGYFCQGELYQMVVKMEELAQEQNLEDVQGLYPDFLSMTAQLHDHLSSLVG